MWAIILKFALGLLGEVVISFIRALQERRADNESLLKYTISLVETMENSPDLTNDQKKEYVVSNMKQYAIELGVDLTGSLTTGLIDAAIQHVRRLQGAKP